VGNEGKRATNERSDQIEEIIKLTKIITELIDHITYTMVYTTYI
jgi:hypothetical protein